MFDVPEMYCPGLGLKSCFFGLGIGLDDFRISGLGHGLGIAIMGLDYISAFMIIVGARYQLVVPRLINKWRCCCHMLFSLKAQSG